MTTNLIDVLTMWFGSGPPSPKYCQVVTNAVQRSVQFGAEISGAPSDFLELTATAGEAIAAPANALAWHVPDLAALTADEKERVRAAWPPLRTLTGAEFTPEAAHDDDPAKGAVLLEVFPQAFRRLEYLFSSLEIPTSPDDWDIPHTATPRWFWIQGIDDTALHLRFLDIATKQWPTTQPPPTIVGFDKGLAPIYVDAGGDIGRFGTGIPLRIKAFDATGLPIDPDFVFTTFNRLATDSDFERLSVAHPSGGQPYQADKRTVIVLCDQDGFPYTPLPPPVNPPPPTDPDAGVVEALPRLRLVTPGTGDFEFAAHGVLTFAANNGLHGTTGAVGLAMIGTHVRLGVYPHGKLGATTTVDFAPDMFLRLQVLDYRDWFRRNPNPRNRLTRYTEGNLITPLIDGARFLRELYRMFRATYKDIDPTAPEDTFDPYVDVANAPQAGVGHAKLLLTNAWIEAHTPLLGRRGLIAAPEDTGHGARRAAAVRGADRQDPLRRCAGAAGTGRHRRVDRRPAQVVARLGGQRAAARRVDRTAPTGFRRRLPRRRPARARHTSQRRPVRHHRALPRRGGQFTRVRKHHWTVRDPCRVRAWPRSHGDAADHGVAA